MSVDVDLMLGDEELSINEGVVIPWTTQGKGLFQYYERLAAVMVRTGPSPGGGVASWFNPRARRQVETRGLQALLRALAE